ncbi:MAG: methionine--tRNA ligase [Patescibacteria group bacterium]
MITLDDFKKLEIRIGKVVLAEKVPEADKLLRLMIDFGPETRQIISGIALSYPDPSVLVGKLLPVLTNLEPRTIRGLESQGMVLAASLPDTSAGGEAGPIILQPEREVPAGSEVK